MQLYNILFNIEMNNKNKGGRQEDYWRLQRSFRYFSPKNFEIFFILLS